MKNYDLAKNMLDLFSGMLRYSLSNIKSKITLFQELKYIKAYLNIQKIRFSNRINYNITYDEEMLMFEIPYFSLQPLVENAIEHGLLPLENGGVLELTCTSDEKMFVIEIKDNGIGMTKEQLAYVQNNFKYADANNENVGLHNSCRRFKLMFGDRLNYRLDSELGIGTSIIIEVSK